MYTDKSVNQFLDELASKAPVPGGGSGAALSGALAAALLSMVCNLTIGKKGYEAVQDDMRDLLTQSEGLRLRLPQLLEDDTRVYSGVMACYRMPKDSAEEKAARQEAMQKALKEASEVPLQIAECCSKILEMCYPAAEKGNKWAVSDAGVAALLAEASMRSAGLNVLINLGSITDRVFVESQRERLDTLVHTARRQTEEIYAAVVEKL